MHLRCAEDVVRADVALINNDLGRTSVLPRRSEWHVGLVGGEGEGMWRDVERCGEMWEDVEEEVEWR